MSLRAWVATILCTAAIVGPLFLLVALAHAHVPGCHTRACDKRVHAKRRTHWKHLHPWTWRWHHLSAHERAWATCIASHETRGIPWNRKAQTDTGNGYQGATQWLTSTWHSAGGSGHPKDHSLREQLVRTVRWAHVAGSSQWSTSRICGDVA